MTGDGDAGDIPPRPHVKIEFRQRLGPSWQDLADQLGIPSHEQRRFGQGEEPSQMWAWLEDRRRLSDLPDALRAIDRRDLAELFVRRPGSVEPPAVGAGSAGEALPAVWNAAARIPGFVGRVPLLEAVRDRLTGGGTALVQALHGWGGVGKTQMAIEYAHRYASDYDLVWWFSAEQVELLGEQYSLLAIAAGLAEPNTSTAIAIARVRAHLRKWSRWLIIFDNAEEPATLREWLPGGTGHVLITSRNPGWGELAVPVAVDVFTRSESVALLTGRVAGLQADEAVELARALGDLPLAVAQAAGMIAETGMPAAEYRAALADAADLVLAEGTPATYPVPLAAAIRVSVERVTGEDPTAGQLLALCAWCGPEPVPVWLFTRASTGVLEEPLASVATTPLALRRTLGRLGRFGLVRVDAEAVQLHRLTQAVLREAAADPDTRRAHRRRAEALLISAQPDDTSDPAHWPTWLGLVPHLLALDPATSDNPELRKLAARMVWHLLDRGDVATALTLARRLRHHWLAVHGPDDAGVLLAANGLARAYRHAGRHEHAKPLLEEVFVRYRQSHGDDDQQTLTAANNLANGLRDLGDATAARALYEDTLVRRRRVLGDDHPDTLTSVSNLAVVLRDLGEFETARTLHEDALTRRRRTLGDDHPDTLQAANNLATDLRELGEVGKARTLHEDTLLRRRRVLGPDHPATLRTANNLAADLRDLGEVEMARELGEDTLARRRRVLGDDHPDTWKSADSLAADLRTLGER